MPLSALPRDGEPIRLLAVIEAASITGPAKNLLEYCRYAPSMGVDVHLATFVRGNPQDKNLFVRRVEELGLPLHVVAEKGAWDRAAIDGLRSAVMSVKPDVLQTHAVKSHFLARVAGLPRRYPWAAFHHGYTWTSWKTRAYNELDRWSLRRANAVFTVSGPFREELVGKGVRRERVRVIHNAIAPEWGQAARQPEAAGRLRKEIGIAGESKVALIVGRLSLEKDHGTLVKAIAALQEKYPVELVIVGDGPERGAIQQSAEELGIRSRVHLVGQQASAEPYYGIADVAVLSSRTEGSPNALLEAMAAGVPAVATRVGGIPEMVTDGESALLVEPGDVTAMRVALDRVLGDPELGGRLIQKAKERVALHHHPVRRAEALTAVYQDLARLSKS
jgi:glycosyltransferase involved in cell wall biosynthesis